MIPVPFRVTSRRPDRAECVTLTLEPADGACPPFEPGQFTMIYAPGIGEIPVSISGRGRGGGGYVQTIRAVGAVSRALCRVKVGDVIGVRGPYGTGFDMEASAGMDVVVAAGGLGLAPLRPVIRKLFEHPGRHGRLSLLVGARTPAAVMYPRELIRWARHFDVRVTVDHPDEAWEGESGLITRLVDQIPIGPRPTYAYVCGPEIMMRATADALVRRGVLPGRIALSLERNMKCGTGHCGHCQLGPLFTCVDGPVVTYDRVAPLLEVPEL